MAIPTDHDLLQRFTAAHDHAAFHELVRRHLDLVHGIARRSLKNPAEADDVTQAVFLLLSQKARRVQRHTTLAGWLFRATHYCIQNAQPAARRRTHHEQKAGGSMPTAPRSTPDELLSILDAALADLPRPIREAVLLRYLEGRTVDETSAQLGISPAAAGKRATRGLDQLRIYFSRHGYATTPTLLTGMLATESATAAPLHLATAIVATLSTGTTAAKTALLAKNDRQRHDRGLRKNHHCRRHCHSRNRRRRNDRPASRPTQSSPNHRRHHQPFSARPGTCTTSPSSNFRARPRR